MLDAPVFALSPDWFNGLSAFVVIGQSVFTLVSVLQDSIENHSKKMDRCTLAATCIYP